MGFDFKRWTSHGKSAALGMAVVLTLAGCGLLGKEPEDKTAGYTAEQLYAEAHDEMDAGGWGNAVKLLASLQTRFPFGRYAQQAQLEIAYADFKDGEPELAIAACNRFIKQYPNSPDIDYVYYLKGLINFNDDLGILSFISRQDLTERDPKALRDAFDTFRELVTRYPNSKYVPDSIARMKYLVNAMAAHEVHVASYYLRRGAYVAAVGRSQGVLINYQQSPATEEALQIMVDAYEKMDMPALRDDAHRVLLTNFPQHDIDRERAADSSWWKFWD